MDQILGVPKMNIDVKERCKFTVSARLSRLEDQVNLTNSKLDDCIDMLKMMRESKSQLEIQGVN